MFEQTQMICCKNETLVFGIQRDGVNL